MSSANGHALRGVDRYFHLQVHNLSAPQAELVPLYALRYAVYCEECAFLPPQDYPDKLEWDLFDQRSVHFSAVNESEEVVGTSRLVLDEQGDQGFPLMTLCPPDSDFRPPAASASAEVSRLAVNRKYRRRAGDTLFGINEAELERKPGERDPVSGERRANAPLLVLGLYREMYCYSRKNGIRYWYAAMEDSLARVLRMFGFNFEVIGPRQDYYGPVCPYLGDLDALESQLKQGNPELLAWFQSPL